MAGCNDPVPAVIETRDQLVCALREAAELEHLFMCQYLYAAFSMKKRPDPECTEAELEYLRRWASTLYMVARQEMEHLALVNGMLAAIGELPHFGRPQIPATHWGFAEPQLLRRVRGGQPCPLPFVLERFESRSVQRYACMEAPHFSFLPPDVQDRMSEWCFEHDDGDCSHVAPSDGHPGAATKLAATPAEIEIGSIQELYEAIASGFGNLGEALFVGDPARQVDVLVQYNIQVFPVVDVESARRAIQLIKEQGEGIDAPPGFDVHFQRFYDMAVQLDQVKQAARAAGRTFVPSHPVPTNPEPPGTEPARALWDLFNYSYVTVLYVLSGLYRYSVPEEASHRPHLGPALSQNALSGAMTMLVRALGELLVAMPGDAGGPIGPGFVIPPEDEERLAFGEGAGDLADIRFYVHRFDEVVAVLDELLPDLPGGLVEDARYIRDNSHRMSLNLAYTDAHGVYAKFRT